MDLPIIFKYGARGYTDVREGIKASAIDFLEKPFSNECLLESISESRADASNKHRDEISELRKRYTSLTNREREIIPHIVAGMSNRNLAELLALSNRTIEVHHSRVMKKMGAKSLADLVQKYAMCQKAGLQ